MTDTEEQEVTSVEVKFSNEVFSLETIKKASYRLIGRASINIIPNEDHITCVLEFSLPISQGEANFIMHDFRAEVLDQDLRKTISEETAPMRNAILAFAFSNTSLQTENEDE